MQIYFICLSNFKCTQDLTPQHIIIFDYTNMDEVALTNHIKNIDFNHLVFSKPLIQQAEIFTNLLIEARSKFIPSKIIYIRPTDEPWTNTYTRLLLRKRTKTISYSKKANCKYLSATNRPNIPPDIVTSSYRLFGPNDVIWTSKITLHKRKFGRPSIWTVQNYG